MAFGYKCVRCGREEEEHSSDPEENPRLYRIAFRRLKKYSMSMFQCIETDIPKEYRTKRDMLRWGTQHYDVGYVSPHPQKESENYDEDMAPQRALWNSVVH